MEAAPDRSTVSEGVFTALGLNVVQVPLLVCCSLLGSDAGFLSIGCIGVSQFLYVGPALWLAGRKRHANAVRGLWIGAGITFLLNATCWAVGFAMISGASHRF
jgi:hypothetical protein